MVVQRTNLCYYISIPNICTRVEYNIILLISNEQGDRANIAAKNENHNNNYTVNIIVHHVYNITCRYKYKQTG